MVSHVKLCLLELMATDHCNLGCSEDNPRLTVFPFPPPCKRSTIISASPTQLNGPIFQYLSQFEVFLNPQTPPEMPLLLQTTFSVKLCTSLKTANSLWSQSPRSLDAVLAKWEASVFLDTPVPPHRSFPHMVGEEPWSIPEAVPSERKNFYPTAVPTRNASLSSGSVRNTSISLSLLGSRIAPLWYHLVHA